MLQASVLRFPFLATNNKNVFSQLRHGKSRVGRTRIVPTALLLRHIHRGIESIPFYIRAHRNLPTDPIARADGDRLNAFVTRLGMAGIINQWRWNSLCRYGSVGPWCAKSIKR